MLVGQVGDIGHEVCLVDTIRYLGDDDLVVALTTLDLSLGTHHDTAATCLIGITNTLQTIDIGTCGEVGARDILHQTVGVDVGVVDIGTAAVNHLTEVMGRHVGSHTDGNTVTTVHQQIGNLGRHDGGLLQGVIEVRRHVDRLFLEVVHDMLTHLRETALGISHGSGRVTVHRTEVTLTVDERITHVPVLGHTDEGTIDGTVAVGVILTKYLTYYARTFFIRLCGNVVDSHHTEEDTTVYGFEAVAHIGKGTCHND